ncbi:MAG TPA: tetratricopeptide repeat protein [Afifellaceae bacterium]|nr:tetratricopeptide repeat protein [Afifellaceae bacterium]
MRTSRIGVIAAVFAVALSGGAWAFDPAKTTPGEAFRSGYAAYKKGETQEAVEALSFAAEKGHAAALWKLARMYATGDGVQEDDAKAFHIYSRIANENADGNPRGRDAPFIADAFVALGGYLRSGVPGGIQPDEGRARRFFAYAASYFGDPEAQYQLAGMYLRGQGGEKNERQAVRWFKLAAEKGHARAQAAFGQALFKGIGVARNQTRGLMWLDLAARSAEEDGSILTMHEEAFATATEGERSTAEAQAQAWLDRRSK